ncbi:MAG: ABC transporter substrate binding protein [Stellaceae bacterium]
MRSFELIYTGADPVAEGLVASLARPGGNPTGFSILVSELMPKRLELLSGLVPQGKVIALLVNPNNAASERGVRVRDLRRKDPQGREPADLPVQQPRTFELAINLKTAKALGLVVPQPIFGLADEVIE